MSLRFSVLSFVLCFSASIGGSGTAYIANTIDETCDWVESFVKQWDRHAELRCIDYLDGYHSCTRSTSMVIDTSYLSHSDRIKTCRYIHGIEKVRHLTASSADRKSSFGPTSCGFITDRHPVMRFTLFD